MDSSQQLGSIYFVSDTGSDFSSPCGSECCRQQVSGSDHSNVFQLALDEQDYISNLGTYDFTGLVGIDTGKASGSSLQAESAWQTEYDPFFNHAITQEAPAYPCDGEGTELQCQMCFKSFTRKGKLTEVYPASCVTESNL